MGKDKLLTGTRQEISTNWDDELNDIVKTDEKKPDLFAGFSVKAQAQVYEEIVHELWNIKNDTALRCLLFITRQTLGWNKDFDRLSISQFEKGIKNRNTGEFYFKGIGKTKKYITKALNELVESGYILKSIFCPECEIEVQQVLKITKKVDGDGKRVKTKQVPNHCPHCQKQLLGREHIYYGLHFKPTAVGSNRGGVSKGHTGGGVERTPTSIISPSIKNSSSDEINIVHESSVSHPKKSDDDSFQSLKTNESLSQPELAKADLNKAPKGTYSEHTTKEHERIRTEFKTIFGRGLTANKRDINECLKKWGVEGIIQRFEIIKENNGDPRGHTLFNYLVKFENEEDGFDNLRNKKKELDAKNCEECENSDDCNQWGITISAESDSFSFNPCWKGEKLKETYTIEEIKEKIRQWKNENRS